MTPLHPVSLTGDIPIGGRFVCYYTTLRSDDDDDDGNGNATKCSLCGVNGLLTVLAVCLFAVFMLLYDADGTLLLHLWVPNIFKKSRLKRRISNRRNQKTQKELQKETRLCCHSQVFCRNLLKPEVCDIY